MKTWYLITYPPGYNSTEIQEDPDWAQRRVQHILEKYKVQGTITPLQRALAPNVPALAAAIAMRVSEMARDSTVNNAETIQQMIEHELKRAADNIPKSGC